MRKSIWLEKSNNNENNLEKNKKEIIKQEKENRLYCFYNRKK